MVSAAFTFLHSAADHLLAVFLPYWYRFGIRQLQQDWQNDVYIVKINKLFYNKLVYRLGFMFSEKPRLLLEDPFI
ncbi:hypothetical protein VN24_13435 [Paenibacillus beijingensis]|uniref:Uncharacterized protein n=1 Tax=Paenibacillus beijingensis TaxID=1126833 RepID=A0A0D5NK49_9BACL|nr:hypothetical protein VN24_13435 [Paenibacillus beijingensis]